MMNTTTQRNTFATSVLMAALIFSAPVCAQVACTDDERNLIYSSSQCVAAISTGGNCPEFAGLAQRLQHELSKSCLTVLAQAENFSYPAGTLRSAIDAGKSDDTLSKAPNSAKDK